MREEVVRNTATKVIFRQEQTWDKCIVRDALGGLSKENMELLSYLDRGQAIVKLPSVWVPIRTDTLPPPKTKRLRDWEVKKAMGGFISKQEMVQEAAVEMPLEKRFLAEIHKKPQAPLTSITKALRIKTQKGYELKDNLLADGYIEEETIRLGRGRPRSAYKLTKKGLEELDQDTVNKPPQHGKSEHLMLKDKIASKLKGWDVKIEDGCDISAKKDGYEVAIEVETCKTKDKNHILRNIRRDSSWADEIVMVCPSKKTEMMIKKLVKTENTPELTIITYEQIEKLNDILKPRLTIKWLSVFWEQYSVGGRLSTTGLRKLVSLCFNTKDPEKWMEKPIYSDDSKYPFWDQSIKVQAQILSILKTHPEGKRIAGDIENKVKSISS
jgi:DNA-binding PadR family transcriptional regulator